jgi:hypothetical protein
MQEESMRQSGNDDDIVIESMRKKGIEITRENYLEYIFPEGVPEDYGAELEAEMPEQLRE